MDRGSIAGTSTRVIPSSTPSNVGTFHNPGELWEVMKRCLRQLSVDADAEAVTGLAIILAHDFPSFADRVVNVLVFILNQREIGARMAVFIVMILNKLVLQGSAILGPANPYINIVNRHMTFILKVVCCHGGVVHHTFHECIKSWTTRGLYSPLFFQEVLQLESKWRREFPNILARTHDYATALAENSPDVLDMVWIGIVTSRNIMTPGASRESSDASSSFSSVSCLNLPPET